MTCDEFMATLQQQLDHHERPEDHRGIQQHASECASCRGRLWAWQQIATVLPADSSHHHHVAANRGGPRHLIAAAILAMAAVLLASFLFPRSPEPTMVVVASNSATPAGEHVGGSVDAVPANPAEHSTYVLQTPPGLWLEQAQPRVWLGRTLPTVRSFREGVAPIGRSLLRAVTLLTTAGKG